MNYTSDKIKVRYNETDQMGIVHHSNYLKFFELARIEWLEKKISPKINGFINFNSHLTTGKIILLLSISS